MKTSRMILEIETEVRNSFKAKCVLQGKTMREVLTEFMQNYKPEKQKGGGGTSKKR